MKKMDVVLCVAILSVAVLFLLFNSTPHGQVAAHIYVEGELKGIFDIGIYDTGSNSVEVTAGGAYMLYADCRSQDCVRMGVISRPGQMIVCLPNRVMVRLEGAAREDDLDAVAG